jgi:transcriptional regulator with PAS, ATPase and Fis domain
MEVTDLVSTSLIGTSPAITQLRDEILLAARCDAKVLITGESGAGKEVVARLIHESSARRRSPLVTVNCAALSDTLLETELFGHVRGSFTGAYRDRSGAFEQAHRGTVFMDEIGETTPRMQGLLLRFLETGEIQRVGSDRTQTRVDVRVIAATNRVLVDAVSQKLFREDLYYRLNVVHLYVAPLRERPDDIPLLLHHFIRAFSRQYQSAVPAVSEEALQALRDYAWPGNVRELKNIVERVIVRTGGREIDVSDLPADIVRGSAAAAQATPAPGSGKVLLMSVADTLFHQMVRERQSFWSVVYGPFMSRDLTRADLRALVKRGLESTSGNYKVLVELFNMKPDDYKRFLGFLRKYHCHIPFQQFRSAALSRPAAKGAEGNNSSDAA